MFSGIADRRFSLLMLDPNEYYFDDYSVEYYPDGLTKTAQQKDFNVTQGTLKVCSKSIVFVPSNSCDSIIRVRQRDMSNIDSYRPSNLSLLRTKKIEGDVFTIDASITQCIQSSVTAIATQRKPTTLYFSLLYVAADKVIPFLQQLNRASQLHHVEHQTMIAMIAHHRQSLYPFKSMFFDDLYEKECGNYVVDMVEPLVNVPGRIVVSESRLYFQPFSNAFSMADILKWKLESITQVICRSYILQDVGLEIFIYENNVTSKYLFVLDSAKSRNDLHEFIVTNRGSDLEDSNQSNMTIKWQNGVISNYEYLMYLNNISDRTVNNLSQYPVFPWIITDYTSETLELDNPTTYRNLMLPIGALNEKRLNNILVRYKEMPEPRFMYGSHYSTPGFVTYYLTRSRPDLMLCLMGGKFDHPDRLFSGIQETWNNVLNNSADFKELIPEFYQGDGAFLENRMKLVLGKRQNGTVVNDVDLPPWACDPQDFITKMGAALESEYVSSKLHHWIDLIFGYKQQGALAEQNQNVFHQLCYPGSVDLNAIIDPNERNSVLTQILEFGQVPQLIFTKAHPERKLAVPYATLQVNTQAYDEEYQDSVGSNDNKQPARKISTADHTSIGNFKVSNKIPIKKHVTFFIECVDTHSVFIGTASGMLYTYRLPDMKYAYGVIICNVSLTCAVDLQHSICVGSSDGKCYFLSKQQGSVYQTFPAHYDTITHIVQDRELMFSSSWDSSVKMWSLTSTANNKVKAMRLVNELDHEDKVQCIAVSGALLVSCVMDSVVVVWDWDALEVLHTVDYTHHDITRVTMWNNKIILMGVSVLYIDSRTFKEDFSKRFDAAICCSQLIEASDLLVLAECGGKITLFNLVEGAVTGELLTDHTNPTHIYLRDELLLVGGDSKNFVVYQEG